MDQKLTAIRSALADAAIETQALGNRLLHLGPHHRDRAQAVRAQAHALSQVVRDMAPADRVSQSLNTFFEASPDDE